MPVFADNLRRLTPVDHIERLELIDEQGQIAGVIENKPGSAGSVAVYHSVTQTNGRLDRAAAAQALDLYAEHVADARAQPGRHSNIDRLFQLIADDAVLRMRIIERTP